MINLDNIKNTFKNTLETEDKIDRSLKQAGVFILLLPKKDDLFLILEKRVQDNSVHSGQISLVGGKVDKTDKSILDAALRETKEEIGIEEKQIELIGKLKPTVTLRSNYHVYPFIGSINTDNFKISTGEIERLILIPVNFLVKSHPFEKKKYKYKGAERETLIIRYKKDIIWGATARILDQFITKLKEKQYV